MLALRSAPDDVETLNAIFRSAHSIKGGAGSFGLTNLVRFTHALENLLDRLAVVGDAGHGGGHQPAVAIRRCAARHARCRRGRRYAGWRPELAEQIESLSAARAPFPEEDPSGRQRANGRPLRKSLWTTGSRCQGTEFLSGGVPASSGNVFERNQSHYAAAQSGRSGDGERLPAAC